MYPRCGDGGSELGQPTGEQVWRTPCPCKGGVKAFLISPRPPPQERRNDDAALCYHGSQPRSAESVINLADPEERRKRNSYTQTYCPSPAHWSAEPNVSGLRVATSSSNVARWSQTVRLLHSKISIQPCHTSIMPTFSRISLYLVSGSPIIKTATVSLLVAKEWCLNFTHLVVISTMKGRQKNGTETFLNGKYVVSFLPSGSGKSLVKHCSASWLPAGR